MRSLVACTGSNANLARYLPPSVSNGLLPTSHASASGKSGTGPILATFRAALKMRLNGRTLCWSLEEVAGDRVAIHRCGVGFPAIALVHDSDQFPSLRAVSVEQAGPFEILGEGLAGYFAEELVNDYLVLPLDHRSSSRV